MRLYKRGRIWWTSYFDAQAGETVRRSTKLTDRSAAHALAARFERHGADPDRAAAEEATLSGALDDVIAEYEQREREKKCSAATVDFYRKRAKQILRLVVDGTMPDKLSELRPRHVDAMINQRRIEESTRNTISKDLIMLRLALKLAKRRGGLKADIDELLPHRFSADYKPRERWLTHAELWALLAELKPERAAWVAFAIATGANLSETQKARRSDVGAWTVHLRGTKRETRDRQVPIVRPWQEALLLAALSVHQRSELFASWTKVGRDLHLACKRAGVPLCSTNDLRRTYGTWQRADGTELKELAGAMGHATTRMAELVYARLSVEQLGALMVASSTVPNLYGTHQHQTDLAHSAHNGEAMKPLESGSDCRTRTCDPVINSHLDTPCNDNEIGPECARFRHLARAAATTSVLWDLLDEAVS